MCKFEQIGVNLQTTSESIAEAESRFSRSCDICCHRGLRIDCGRCAIETAHKLTVAALNEVANMTK